MQGAGAHHRFGKPLILLYYCVLNSLNTTSDLGRQTDTQATVNHQLLKPIAQANKEAGKLKSNAHVKTLLAESSFLL